MTAYIFFGLKIISGITGLLAIGTIAWKNMRFLTRLDLRMDAFQNSLHDLKHNDLRHIEDEFSQFRQLVLDHLLPRA